MCKEKGKDEKRKAEISENSPFIRKRAKQKNGVHKNFSLAIWEEKNEERSEGKWKTEIAEKIPPSKALTEKRGISNIMEKQS